MLPRRWQIALAVLAAQLALAAPALASDDGEGLVGETDDKLITFFSLGLVLFFTLVVILGTLVQTGLEHRKHAREEARKRSRAGW
jgi:hypothetical protein